MILFTLKCTSNHTFDSWFKDSASYAQQITAQLVECPYCGSLEISKALMAPNITCRSKTESPNKISLKAIETSTSLTSSPEIELRQTLRKLRQFVEKNCDYVGNDFAQEARKIAEGERKTAAIYGQATREEIHALTEEGIDLLAIPWIPLSDA
jgi:hypothetical protein